MDPSTWPRIAPLLDEALELPADERASFVEQVRAREPDIARQLTALLARDDEAERTGFLEPPAVGGLVGLELGGWTLERPLGHGGMGSVWLARRSDGQFDGRAAVKLLNLTLVRPSGLQRFRREGSILARLTHPDIARLLDAGVSPAGQPYLVLEHIDGLRIDEWVSARQCSVAERVRLFIQVLNALEHAHASLVIHRDLKPSNILVTGEGRVKLLDFGIAKLLGDARSDDRSEALESSAPAFHETLDGGALTPEYAAPEQGLDSPITTAVDIYAAGVLLYVLIGGRHPTATGCRTPAEVFSALAERQPRPLGVGDLDTVLAKALAKDPLERYRTVGEFAEDLSRWLRDEPVRARPPSWSYRARKFIRRNRIETAAAVCIVAAIATGTGLSLSQAHRAAAERDRAETASHESDAVNDFLMQLFQVSDPSEARGDTLTAAELVTRAAARIERLSAVPREQARLLGVTGRLELGLGKYDQANEAFNRALVILRQSGAAQSLEAAEMLRQLSQSLVRLVRYPAADSAIESALRIHEHLLGPENPELPVILHEASTVAVYRADLPRAERYQRRALALRVRARGANDSLTGVSHVDLGAILRHERRLPEAEHEFLLGLTILKRSARPDDPQLAEAMLQTAYLLDEEENRHTEAEPLFQQALVIRRRAFGPAHPLVAATLLDWAEFLVNRGSAADAVAPAREGFSITRRAYGPEHPVVAAFMARLASVLHHAGQLDEADSLFQQSLAMTRRLLGPDHVNNSGVEIDYARLLIDRGHYARAEPLLRDAIRIGKRFELDYQPVAKQLLDGLLLAAKRTGAR
jgi:serine/threonine protein kinase